MNLNTYRYITLWSIIVRLIAAEQIILNVKKKD